MKKNNLTKAIALGALVSCLVACDDDEAQSGGEAPAITVVENAAQLDQLFQQIVEIECRFCTQEEAPAEYENLCADILMLELRDDRGEILSGLESGRLEFNAEFYQCASALARQSMCSLARIQCPGQLFTPKVASGGSCLSGRECLSSSCVSEDENSCGMGVCEGEAEAPRRYVSAAIGEPCSGEDDVIRLCADGATCDYSADAPVCRAISYAQQGQSCDGEAVQCSNSLCLPSDESYNSYMCKSFRQAGERCSDYDMCDLSLYCHPEARPDDTDPGTCRPRVASGGACSSNTGFDFASNPCAINHICVDQVCQPIRFLGESCQSNGQCQGRADMTCREGLCAKACN